MRSIIILISVLLLSPVIGVTAEEGEQTWRDIEVDPSQWDDGPVLEGSPMDEPRPGDAVFTIEVNYKTGYLSSRVQGEIVIELFEEWAPNTTENMIMHIEKEIYDGTFFHRVIDDFVTQAGDPYCQTVGVYPLTNAQCGGGGDGHALKMEHNENLSHVDGAIGMARDTDPDSADTQWYIAETEAHNLDPENRNDEGYVTFGIVRNGMSHVRAIALVPTTDDPTGSEVVVNPASSAGRPLEEVKIEKISMIGIIPLEDEPELKTQSSFFSPQAKLAIGSLVSIAILVGLVMWSRTALPEELVFDAEILEAELLD